VGGLGFERDGDGRRQGVGEGGREARWKRRRWIEREEGVAFLSLISWYIYDTAIPEDLPACLPRSSKTCPCARLSNVVYKLIFKVIANRLEHILGDIISLN
jgi:hypothetical protein